MIKVSVIIPVYNAEKYLRRCLDSVIAQSLREIEVICVDDSSTDGSRKILERYAQRDKRIRLIFNEKTLHAGQSRNRGLEAARGEYVLFMDADDRISGDGLDKVYTQACRTDADVLRCRAFDYNNETGELSESRFNALKRVPFFLYGRVLSFGQVYWLLPKLNAAPWGGIAKKSFLVDNNIKFNDLICVNNRSFYWESVMKAERIVFSRTYLISYRTNFSSSLVGRRIRNFDCHFKSYSIVERLTAKQPPKIRRTILNAELSDIANWLEAAFVTEYREATCNAVDEFLKSMDKSAWNQDPSREKWMLRINEVLSKNKKFPETVPSASDENAAEGK